MYQLITIRTFLVSYVFFSITQRHTTSKITNSHWTSHRYTETSDTIINVLILNDGINQLYYCVISVITHLLTCSLLFIACWSAGTTWHIYSYTTDVITLSTCFQFVMAFDMILLGTMETCSILKYNYYFTTWCCWIHVLSFSSRFSSTSILYTAVV